MDVRTERFDDSSLPNSDGSYDYRYTGVTYILSDGERQLVVRCYDDEPGVDGNVRS